MDWVAGTALAVGVGSLALTWQSTRAAKRAIDTSIEIYEKQKIDEIKKDNELILRETIAIKSLLRIEIDKSISIYKNNKSFCDEFLKNNFSSLSFNDRKSLFTVWFHYKSDGDRKSSINILETNSSSYKPYFLDVARLDYELLTMLDLTVEALKTIDKFRDTVIGKLKENDVQSIIGDCLFFTENFSVRLDEHFSKFKLICSKG